MWQRHCWHNWIFLIPSIKFSKNLLAEQVVPFAFYGMTGAAGMITPEGVTVMDLKSGKVILGEGLEGNEHLLKAYLQVLDKEIRQ